MHERVNARGRRDLGGQAISVSAGSTMAMSARMQGSTTRTLFPVAGSVRMATNVASEPVPAVVGIRHRDR
jgi:hypothetical protein